MLVAAGAVTERQVEEALAAQHEVGLRLGETLVSLGYLSEPQMTQVLSNQLSIPWVDLYHVDFSRELLERIPAELAERYRVVPVYVREVRKQGDTLYVATADPLATEALQAVADHSGLPVKPMVAAPSDVEDAIRVYYLGLPPLAESAAAEPDEEVLLEVDPSEPPPPASDESEEADEAPLGRSIVPSMPPPARPNLGFLTLTLLDGTEVRLPSPGRTPAEAEPSAARELTTRDVIHALRARAAGRDVSDVLEEGASDTLMAALLSVLLRKGLVADWEFVTEWKKQRAKKKKP